MIAIEIIYFKIEVSVSDPCDIIRIVASPSGRNRFQLQIDRVRNCGTFLWTVINKTSDRIIRSKIVFFIISSISATTRSHAQLKGRKVIKKLWTFFGPWGRDRSQSPPCWIFRVKQIHQSTASERTTRSGSDEPKQNHSKYIA